MTDETRKQRKHSKNVDPDFTRSVYDSVRLVPFGKVTSYGHIAKLIHKPKNSRLVGQVLKELPDNLADPLDPQFVPWHRIVKSDGRIASRPLAAFQGDRLRLEGIDVYRVRGSEDYVISEERVSMSKYGWFPPCTSKGIGQETSAP